MNDDRINLAKRLPQSNRMDSLTKGDFKMKHMLFAALALISLSLHAQEDKTNDAIPCDMVKGDATKFGCGKNLDRDMKNESYKCLKDIPWELDKKGISKAKSAKIMALADDSTEEISILDGEASFKVKKEDFAKKIKDKLGRFAAQKKKAYVSMMSPSGGEVLLEVTNKDESGSDFKVDKWKQVKKESLSDEELLEKIHYPVGISNKVPHDDSNSDKIAKKFFEGLEDSSSDEINKKEAIYNKKVKDIDDSPELVFEEKRKLKAQAKKEHDEYVEAIKKKKKAAFDQIYKKASKCRGTLPDTVKFVEDKLKEGAPAAATSSSVNK